MNHSNNSTIIAQTNTNNNNNNNNTNHSRKGTVHDVTQVLIDDCQKVCYFLRLFRLIIIHQFEMILFAENS